MKVNHFREKANFSDISTFNLSEEEQKIAYWLSIKKQATIEEIVDECEINIVQAENILDVLETKNILKKIELEGDIIYIFKLKKQKKAKFLDTFLKNIERQIAPVKLSTLIALIFITAFLLLPFVFSSIYFPRIINNNFNFYQFLREDLYKQTTGYIALFFVFLEMILTLRKRGRGWFIKITIPGSLILWRSLHIFVGIGLLGMILIHTAGANGINFNAIFLWVFFAVTLSALVGSTAELAILESPQRNFGVGAQNNNFITRFLPNMSKGKLIRSLRDIWLLSHIFLVNIFFVMLAFHIFLAYYYP